MGAMYRLKAYFGMVPAEEMGEYADEPGMDSFVDRHRAAPRRAADDRWSDAGDRFDYDDRAEDRYDDDWAHRAAARPGVVDRTARDIRAESRIDREPPRGLSGIGGSGLGPPAVRGALAVDPEAGLREPVRPVERPVTPSAVPEQRDRGAAALAKITTLQPRSYNEARTIGERYRDGVPVIMNLTELDDAAAKRLVDFAAGLAFALRGSIDKVTSRVFLLTPADVEVSADDARRLAERGLFRQD
ncbi:cell division protein SepF [Pseudonocardia acidicola]|uniref:Cell division protein SepF n=1 Tax=Pseudonocardia acidicola TaxID=2724939 RepID=A0ABX1SHH2_9PSEU|nr:cell division protein SepF [Pseudonocardia acidicola]NMI00223.1 cell division protein SepF [Pseudonocardia acidicola]